MPKLRRVSVVVAAREPVRELIRAPLTAAGVVIAAEAGDLVEALGAVEERRPQLCVLDRDLPGAGVAAIAALTAPRRRPKLLVIGGSADPAGIRADLLAGASRCLPGPVDGEDVATAVEQLAAEDTRRSHTDERRGTQPRKEER
jgi:DNA-binding NarL/FixJ family response regulator